MKHGQVSPSLLVDVKKVPELNRLEWSERGGLHVGAAVPLNRLLTFNAILERYNILAQACSVIGSTQIRNRGTMGGNICNAAPSADSVPSLMCLGARAVLVSGKGTRKIGLNDFFVAPGETTIGNDDKKLQEVRIALGAVAPTPIRAHNAEAFLTGKSLTQDVIKEVAGKAAAEADPISDLRGSAEYRRLLMEVLTRRTLQECCGKLGLKI